MRAYDIDLDRDRALVEAWQAGDASAFDDLYRLYFDRLRAFCERRVGDRGDAEEIAQEAFAKALQALPRLSTAAGRASSRGTRSTRARSTTATTSGSRSRSTSATSIGRCAGSALATARCSTSANGRG